MVTDFHTWLFNEAGRYVGMRAPVSELDWASLPQQMGDLVFFGVHNIGRFLQGSNGQLPVLSLKPQQGLVKNSQGSFIQPTDISTHVTPIVDVNVQKEMIFVDPEQMQKKPSSFGYRNKGINKIRAGLYRISSKNLRDVTPLLLPDDRANLGNHKVWMVAQEEVGYQARRFNKIRNAILSGEHPEPTPDEQEMSDFRNRFFLLPKAQTTTQPSSSSMRDFMQRRRSPQDQPPEAA